MPDLTVTSDPVATAVRDVIEEAEAILIDAVFDELVRQLVSVGEAEPQGSYRVPIGAEMSNPSVDRDLHSSVQGSIRSPPRTRA